MIKLIVRLSLLVFIGITFGCSKQGFEGVQTHEYDHYMVDFNNDLMRLGYQPIDFRKTEILVVDDLSAYGEKTIAMCDHIETSRNRAARIAVHPLFKTNLINYAQRLSMYHEFGHCFLGLGHNNKHSIMNFNPLGLGAIFNSDDDLIDERRLGLVRDMVESSRYR